MLRFDEQLKGRRLAFVFTIAIERVLGVDPSLNNCAKMFCADDYPFHRGIAMPLFPVTFPEQNVPF